MGHLHLLLDEMGLDKMGLDEMGINLHIYTAHTPLPTLTPLSCPHILTHTCTHPSPTPHTLTHTCHTPSHLSHLHTYMHTPLPLPPSPPPPLTHTCMPHTASTLSSLSTAEQMALNFSRGTPQAANIPSKIFLWFTCTQHMHSKFIQTCTVLCLHTK